MMTINQQIHQRTHSWAFFHLLLWGSIVVSHAIDSSSYYQHDPAGYISYIIIRNGLLIGLAYFNLLYLVPSYLKKGGHIKYTLFLLLTVAIFIVLYNYYLFRYLPDMLGEGHRSTYQFQAFSNFFTAARYLVLSFLLKFIEEWFAQEKKLSQMQVDKLATELNYLRAQINPHFLFNTLNNMHGLVLKKSDKAPELIMRLSEMMNYMLYEGTDSKVPLRKDLDNLVNYVEMEKIRQGNNARLEITISSDYPAQKIVPLLMLPLVENGLKYGVNKQLNNAYITINILIEGHSLFCYVKNSKALKTEQQENHGIGLDNLRKRLELYYPGQHELVTEEEPDHFSATLKIHQL